MSHLLPLLSPRILAVSAALASAVSAQTPAPSPRDEELNLLREQVRLLTEKVQQLEERLPSKAAAPAAATAAAPAAKPSVVTVTDRNINIASGDGLHQLRLRGTIQGDARWFFDDGGVEGNDAFLVRRARIIMEGYFNKYFQFQLTPEFTATGASLQQANIAANLSPAFQIRMGKFKPSVGIEQFQSDPTVVFVERSIATNLVPLFDVGVQASGVLADKRLTYSFGVFNGLPDATASTNTDTDDAKSFAARLMFKVNGNLEVGVGGTFSPGLSAASQMTTGYRTDGQQRFFVYDSTTVSDGDSWRITPQATFYRGSLGIVGEYVASAINVKNATTPRTELVHQAYNLTASYVLTGENASYTGVIPKQAFNLDTGALGAFEIAARVTGVKLDDATFPTFASARTNPTELNSFGVGVNWYLSGAVRFTTDYFHSEFDTATVPTSVLLRSGEDVLVTRVQLVFE